MTETLTLTPNSGKEERKREEEDKDDDDGFEFAFDVPNRRIHPVYPVFNRDLPLADFNDERGEGGDKAVRTPLRRLLVEDREACSRSGSTSSTSSSAAEDLEGVSPDTYCVWAPGSVPSSPSRRKSRSDGSSMRLRLRDVVFGRSRSDGKDRFRFLSPAEEKPPPDAAKDAKVSSAEAGVEKRMAKEVAELDIVTAHRMFYGKPGAAGGGGGGSGRRSFLPYKVGFFPASASGLSRTHLAL